MWVNILTFANEETGLGHWYRSLALAEYIQDQGHGVGIISDRRPGDKFQNYHQVPYRDPTLWRSALIRDEDWLVIDLPDEAPDWLYDFCQEKRVKTCVLNGVGHRVGDRADLRIVQGLGEGEYSGVDYIILRPSVFEAKTIRRPIIEWFVFGGAADRMGLTRRFPDQQRISFSISAKEWQAEDGHDNGFLVAASQCRRACVAMGMTVLELAAWQTMPIYVFSVSETHLKFALNLAEAGYIKAYHKVGLPGQRDLVDFLAQPYLPSGKPIDGRACSRIFKLMISKE